jgi:hypothetical protein
MHSSISHTRAEEATALGTARFEAVRNVLPKQNVHSLDSNQLSVSYHRRGRCVACKAHHLFLGRFRHLVALAEFDDRVELDDVVVALATARLGRGNHDAPAITFIVAAVLGISGDDFEL